MFTLAQFLKSTFQSKMCQRLRSWPSRVTGQTVLAHIQEIPARRPGNVVLNSMMVARYPQITVAAAQQPVSKTVQACTAQAK